MEQYKQNCKWIRTCVVLWLYIMRKKHVQNGALSKKLKGSVKENIESEMAKTLDVGGSIPVDNVQELATKTLETIPPRYIRPELEFDEISVDVSQQVPVIDMSKLDSIEESMKLHQACKDWGFFQLTNHGISESIEKMKKMAEEFFLLPLEEKIVYAQLPNNIEGYGQAFVVSEDQKLDWGDMLMINAQPVSERDMRFWPTSPATFRSALDAYSSDLMRVQIILLRVMAKNLGLDPDDFVQLFENGMQAIRMNYYPPCQHANKVIGLSPHSDSTGLTLLVQVNEVQGLQIKKIDKWIPINPLPNAIIVNIGDTIEILTNGEYKSIEHRVVVNPEKKRLSIGAFHTTDVKAFVGPICELLEEGKGAKFKTVSFYDFVRLRFGNKLDGKSVLDQLRIS